VCVLYCCPCYHHRCYTTLKHTLLWKRDRSRAYLKQFYISSFVIVSLFSSFLAVLCCLLSVKIYSIWYQHNSVRLF
jgi:hypothetical protein